MTRKLQARALAFAMCLVGLATLPAHAHGTPACEALDRYEKHAVSGDFVKSGDKLVFSREDKVVMTITSDRELRFDGEPVELNPRGQALVDAYYANIDKALDEFAGLAGDAASLGITAAGTAIFRLLTGQLDEKEFEREVHAKAEKIKERANVACAYLGNVEQLEKEMMREIPGFKPVIFPDLHSI